MSSGGGGGGEVDREYNARMATIAERQQAMAEEYFQYWKSGPGHWETRTIEGTAKSGTSGSAPSKIKSAFESLLPKTEQVWVKDPDGVSYMDMEQAQMKANMELIPKQTKYMSTFLDAETGLVPQRAGLESALIAEQQENIALRKPVTSKFYDEVLKGVDVDERVNLARADVESAYAGAESNARRWASSMGINPASKSYSAGLMSLAKEKAAAKVGATSLARRQAEEENFARLSSAVGLGSA
ncbi:MAG TPA: hypothetical protein PK183_09530 [Bacillota bacterium]|nr:hypothetical protein [Bacillota bacterium]